MGRKTAPQPLALDGRSNALGEEDPPAVGETHPQQSSPLPPSSRSPASQASPRSPRSAFNFTPNNIQTFPSTEYHSSGGKKSPLHVADLLQQGPPQQDQSSQQPLAGPSFTPTYSTYKPQDQQPYQLAEATSSSIYSSPPNPNPDPYPTPNPPNGQAQRYLDRQLDKQEKYQQNKAIAAQQQQQEQLRSPGHPRHQQRNQEEKASKSNFFNFGKSSKSTDRVQTEQSGESRSEGQRGDTTRPPTVRQNSKQQDPAYTNPQPPNQYSNAAPSRSEQSLVSSAAEYKNTGSSSKKQKPKPFNLLGRSRSIKDKDRDSPSNGTSPGETRRTPNNPSSSNMAVQQERQDSERGQSNNGSTQQFPPLRTAPLQAHDRGFRDMASSVRTHSAERAQAKDVASHSRRDYQSQHQHDSRDNTRGQPSSNKDNGGSSGFFSGLKSSGGKAADMISGKLFGKSGRSFSTTERGEPTIDDESYQLKVINLPLVEQTRRTRICKRLEFSKDKTEFWMPAFPWRAIDYLNYKGSEVEGLYRVPGSGPQIKKWQRRFDEELDLDLFAQKDLYDINIVGSMLKAWLRELPDELFPKEAQERIVRECAGAETVPQLLIDELSKLPPYNYYLLFAITCHLSLLLAHSDKNKMDFRNLCICFQPCLKIDVFCFKFLVCDWRDCWKGCHSEQRYINEEYAIFHSPPPPGTLASRKASTADEPVEEQRNVSSSDGSQMSSTRNADHRAQVRLRKQPATAADNQSVETTETAGTASTSLTVHSELVAPPGRTESNEMRPLSPIKPLSPLGF